MEILDQLEHQTKEQRYFKKSALLFKICLGLLLFPIFVIAFIKPLFKVESDKLDLFVGLPMFAMLFLSPIGLIYGWKSVRKKEGNSKLRFLYFIGHLFFSFLILAMFLAIFSDLSQLL